METYKSFKKIVTTVFAFVFMSLLFVSSESSAATAEYKCTSKCTFCVTIGKKVVCSEKFSEDSDDFEKSRQLKKFVNDGLINPDDSLKQGFSLDTFNQKYFNCEIMIRKAEQIQEAAQKMCVAKTVRYEKTTFQKRAPASTAKPKAKKTKYSN